MRREIEINRIEDLPPLLLQILGNRGITEEKEIRKFLYGKIEDLNDPFLMKDMEKAVERINRAIDNKERVIVFGDYDADGISATALIIRYFRDTYNYKMDYYLPDRQKDGYGLNREVVQEFCRKKYDLLLTVDCGITAVEEIAFARENGLDVIVTDHHQPADNLPPALALIDPLQKEDSYPDKYLAGVGVALKLCQAVEFKRSGKYISEKLGRLFDIAALGTVADIVPLKGENRIITRKGLELINDTGNPGLKELIRRTGLNNKEIGTGHIAYIIAPHLNAAGRMSTPDLCLELLLTDDHEKAAEIAEELVIINRARQELQDRILGEAIEMVESEMDLEVEKGIVLASRNWNHGVIGIVASKLVELYHRPAVLIAVAEDGTGKGSCRSINGLDIYQALSKCSGHLESFGGHKMAAGLTIDGDRIADFRVDFNRILDELLDRDDLIPVLELDSIIETADISMELYRYISLLEPFGTGNHRPRFLLKNVGIKDAYPVGRDKRHLKFFLEDGLAGISFNCSDSLNGFLTEKLDLAFHLELNEWNGTESLQIILEDFNIASRTAYYPLEYRSEDFILLDKRGCRDIPAYLKNIYNKEQRAAIYINNFSLYHELKREIGSQVYLAGEAGIENKLKYNGGSIFFFTPNLLEEMEKTGSEYHINDLVFLSLPFSLEEMKRYIDFFVFEKLRIHLLYSRRDALINKEIIQRKIPSTDFLRHLYIFLKRVSSRKILLEKIHTLFSDYGKIPCNQEILKKGLDIFEELGLLEKEEHSISLLPGPVEKLDLSSSISYNKSVNIIKSYNCFVDLAMREDLYQLLDKLKSI